MAAASLKNNQNIFPLRIVVKSQQKKIVKITLTSVLSDLHVGFVHVMRLTVIECWH